MSEQASGDAASVPVSERHLSVVRALLRRDFLASGGYRESLVEVAAAACSSVGGRRAFVALKGPSAYIPHIEAALSVEFISGPVNGLRDSLKNLESRLFLPDGQKPLDLSSVGYGALDEGGLLGAKDTVHQAPFLPATPLVIGAVAGVGVVGASAGRLAADLRS